MRALISDIKKRIYDKEMNIHGWEMRIKQGEEDIWNINKRLNEFKPILKEHKEDLIKLNSLLANRIGVKK